MFFAIKYTAIIFHTLCVIAFILQTATTQDVGGNSYARTNKSFATEVVNLYQMAFAAINDDAISRKIQNVSFDLSTVKVAYMYENFAVGFKNISVWEFNPISINFTCDSSAQPNVTILPHGKSYAKVYIEYPMKSLDTSEITNASYLIPPFNIYFFHAPKHPEILHLAMQKSNNYNLTQSLVKNITQKNSELVEQSNERYYEFSKRTCSRITNENLLKNITLTEFAADNVNELYEIEISAKTAHLGLLIFSKSDHFYVLEVNSVDIRGQHENNRFHYFVDSIVVELHATSKRYGYATRTARNFRVKIRNSVLNDDVVREKVFDVVETELKNALEGELLEHFSY